MAVDVIRAVEEMDRIILQAERETTLALRRYLEEAHRRIQRQLSAQLDPDTIKALAREGRVFREARARAILAQLDASLQALDLGTSTSGGLGIMRDVITLGQQEGHQQVGLLLERLGDDAAHLALATQVNFAAIEAQVANSAARLTRYGAQTVDKINQAVINGLVEGRGPRRIAYDVRRAVLGDPNAKPLYRRGVDSLGRERNLLVQGRGGLAFQAETIARTELISSLEDARQSSMREADITMALWVATPLDNTCEYCAARDGHVYKLSDIVLPAHPRCRCATSPIRREWIEGGLVDLDSVREHQQQTRDAFREAHGDRKRFATGPTPFEKAQGWTKAPKPAWTTSGGW